MIVNVTGFHEMTAFRDQDSFLWRGNMSEVNKIIHAEARANCELLFVSSWKKKKNPKETANKIRGILTTWKWNFILSLCEGKQNKTLWKHCGSTQLSPTAQKITGWKGDIWLAERGT